MDAAIFLKFTSLVRNVENRSLNGLTRNFDLSSSENFNEAASNLAMLLSG